MPESKIQQILTALNLIQSPLEVLDLRGNYLGSSEAVDLVELLEQARSLKVLDMSAQETFAADRIRIELKEATKVMLNLRTKKGYIRVVNASTDQTIHEIATKRITLAIVRTLETEDGY